MEKMEKYKLKVKFDNFGPKSKKYTVWICDGKGPDGLPCGYESEKCQTVRHFASKHLKIKHYKHLKISVLLSQVFKLMQVSWRLRPIRD